MKNSSIYKLSALMVLALSLAIISCSDWNEVESLGLKNQSLKEQYPKLYADYIQDLIKYKTGEHKVTFVSFDNPQRDPVNQAERLTAIPDSVDFICLNHPDDVSPEIQKEMTQIREKGIHTLYAINYENFKEEWEANTKINPEFTEEEALAYFGKRTDDMLAICDKYNYDGIIIDYTGQSLVSMVPENLAKYNKRQKNFFNRIVSWREKHDHKTLVFYGNVQYLVPENLSMMEKYNYIALKSVLSTSGDDIAVKAYLALQAGEDVKDSLYEGVNPVPANRFIACVELPQADDKEQVKGYWNTKDANGNKIVAALGTAQWIGQYSPDFTRSGLFVMSIQNDYYNNTYGYLREVISIMNPNK